MEKINGRRGFLKGFGLGGVVLGGVVGGYHTVTREVVALANSNVAAGAGGNVDNTPVPRAPDIAHLAPISTATTLMLSADNRPPPPPPPPAPIIKTAVGATSYYISTSTIGSTAINPTLSVGHNFNHHSDEQMSRVVMSVGKDNRLWIKVGDDWKRVVVEG